ncbi:MAG: EamA family transporter [Anaerolineae bacterium]
MQDWLLFSMLALLCWGFYGFLPKLAVDYLAPRSVLLFQSLGTVAVGMVSLISLGFRPQLQGRGAGFAILSGMAGAIGGLFYILAVQRGRVSTISALTALYPALVIVLAVTVLHEPITARQGLGMALAVVAVILLSL